MDDKGIELLAHDKTLADALRQPNIRKVIDTLPVRSHPAEAQTVQKSITQEKPEPIDPDESPTMQAVLTALSWTTYTMAIVVTLFLAWVTAGTLGR